MFSFCDSANKQADRCGVMAEPPLPNPANPRVYLDVQIGAHQKGRITIELYADIVPKTAENFRCLCTGEKGFGPRIQKPLHYKNTPVHRVFPQLFLVAGDIECGTGAGGSHIWSRGGRAIPSEVWPPVPTEAFVPAPAPASLTSGIDATLEKSVSVTGSDDDGAAVAGGSRDAAGDPVPPPPPPLRPAQAVVDGPDTGDPDAFWRYFPDESFQGHAGRHTGFGCLSMHNTGPDENASQFCLAFGHTPWLNGKQVVLGTVRDGFDTLRAIEKVGSRSGQTQHPVTIVGCGMIK